MRHLFLVLPFVFVACGGGKFDDDDDDDDAWGRPHHDSGDDADGEDGSVVFASKCSVCHGSDGGGTATAPDLADRIQRLPMPRTRRGLLAVDHPSCHREGKDDRG